MRCCHYRFCRWWDAATTVFVDEWWDAATTGKMPPFLLFPREFWYLAHSKPLGQQRHHYLYDAFKGHKGERVEELLKDNYLLPVPIPSNCTNSLQPVDVSANKPLKDHLQNPFTSWYALQVQQQLEKGTSIDQICAYQLWKNLRLVSALILITLSVIQTLYLKKAGIMDAIEG